MDWQLGREVGGGLEGCEGDWESGEAVGAGGCVNKVPSFQPCFIHTDSFVIPVRAPALSAFNFSHAPFTHLGFLSCLRTLICVFDSSFDQGV